MAHLFIHPSLIYFMGAVFMLIPVPPLRKLIQLIIPLAATAFLIQGLADFSSHIFGFSFHWIRVDPLSLSFVYIFILFSFLANLYSLHQNQTLLLIPSNIYIGSSIGAVLAGDMLTLFIFLELMAISSTIMIWNPNRPNSAQALFRYFLIHLFGGLLVFSGMMIYWMQHQTLDFSRLSLDQGGWLIFLGFAVNAAIPPLHAWVPDAYPESTPEAGVYLSAFTTKVAVYTFARAFAGEEILILLGGIAAVYGVIYALFENDMRRLLSYHLICQVGYMLCGIGIGSQLGVNGATAHAIGNILFKGLLFMATGSVIYMTGKYKLHELGGLYQKNKWLFRYYFIAALAISGMPFLNGYVSKTLLMASAEKAHLASLEMVLLLVAGGTFFSIALKMAYKVFFAHATPAEIRLQPLPMTMHLAMGTTTLLCILFGVFPNLLFHILPYQQAVKNPFEWSHMLSTVGVLVITFFIFKMIKKKLKSKDTVSWDVDWIYRRGAEILINHICRPILNLQVSFQNALSSSIAELDKSLKQVFPRQTLISVAIPLVWIVATFLVIGLVLLRL